MSDIKVRFLYGNTGPIEASTLKTDDGFKKQYLMWEKRVLETAWKAFIAEKLGHNVNQVIPEITLIQKESNKKES